MKRKRTGFSPLKYIIYAALTVGLFVLCNMLFTSGVLPRTYGQVAMRAGIYVIAAVSLNLTCGFLGQLPLGHAGFMAVGAYVSAIITKMFDFGGNETVAFAAAVAAAGLAASVMGVIIGLPALRLKGDYLAIITLAAGEMIRVILQNITVKTEDGVIADGAAGIQRIPAYTNFAWVFWMCAATIFVTYTLTRSKAGRAVISIRENEIAAESCGVHTTYYKTLAFVVAAFFAGISGALYANFIRTVQPGDFDFNRSIEILVMVVLGGMGSIVGSVLSATVLTVLPELLRSFNDYRMVVYSLLLVIVMIFKPSGLMGRYELSLSSLFGVLARSGKRKEVKEGESNG